MSADLNKLAIEVQVDPEHDSIAYDPARFRTARWSAIVVVAESQMPWSRAPLTELCRFYWHPLYAFARRRGHGLPHDEDLTREVHSLVAAGGRL